MLNRCSQWRPLRVAQEAESGSFTFSDASLKESSAPIWLAGVQSISARVFISKTSADDIRLPFCGAFKCRFHDIPRCSSFLTQSIKIQSRDEPAQFECCDGKQMDGHSQSATRCLPLSLNIIFLILISSCEKQLHWSSLFSFSAPFFGLMSLVAQTPSRISVDLIRFVCVRVLRLETSWLQVEMKAPYSFLFTPVLVSRATSGIRAVHRGWPSPAWGWHLWFQNVIKSV